MEKIIGHYQSGFRRNKFSIDQIITIGQLFQKTWEFNEELHTYNSLYTSKWLMKQIVGLWNYLM